MLVSPAQRRIWQQRRQEAIASAQTRERAARRLDPQAAVLLRQGWPGLESVWLFGSVAEGRTQSSSDVDLAVSSASGGRPATARAELDSLVRLECLPAPLAAAHPRAGHRVVTLDL